MAGRRYLVDHGIAWIRRDREEKEYRAYMTDCLRVISESAAKFAGGKYMSVRFADRMGWGKKPVVDSRTAEEIIKSIADKINGEEEL